MIPLKHMQILWKENFNSCRISISLSNRFNCREVVGGSFVWGKLVLREQKERPPHGDKKRHSRNTLGIQSCVTGGLQEGNETKQLKPHWGITTPGLAFHTLMETQTWGTGSQYGKTKAQEVGLEVWVQVSVFGIQFPHQLSCWCGGRGFLVVWTEWDLVSHRYWSSHRCAMLLRGPHINSGFSRPPWRDYKPQK